MFLPADTYITVLNANSRETNVSLHQKKVVTAVVTGGVIGLICRNDLIQLCVQPNYIFPINKQGVAHQKIYIISQANNFGIACWSNH